MRDNFALYVKLLPFRDHGPALSPFNALMALNDLRTLRSRMDLLSRNTLRVAHFLAQHPAVEAVSYPGLPDDPGHAVASEYMWLADGEDDYAQAVNRYGHLLAFTMRGGPSAARQVFDGLQMVWRATDLGRIKSVATIPAISTHQQQGEAGRSLADVPGNLIRLSAGAEHPDDIIADLDQALRQAEQPARTEARVASA
jgi:cystathionine beta-lyase/cystathionine gamma-synthase